jgi:hypothetical protein
MRIHREFSCERGFAAAFAPTLPLRTAVWVAFVAWIVGTLTRNNVRSIGGISKSAAHSLDIAILAIGLPAIFSFIGIFYYIYRRRAVWRGEKEAGAASDIDSASS